MEGTQFALELFVEEARMDNDLRCDHCGLEMTAIFTHGLDQYGNRVLRPILVAGDNGLFMAVQCPIHGETFHRVAAIGDDTARAACIDTASKFKNSGLRSAFSVPDAIE